MTNWVQLVAETVGIFVVRPVNRSCKLTEAAISAEYEYCSLFRNPFGNCILLAYQMLTSLLELKLSMNASVAIVKIRALT